MDSFIKTYKKIISESEDFVRPDYDSAKSILEENGYAPLRGRSWDDGYSTCWGKNYSANILFVIKTMGSGYKDMPDGGSYATSLKVMSCEIYFTKANKASLFYSDSCKTVDDALNQLDSAIEEIKKEFIGE